jgi:hypothetical protein
MDNQGYVKRTLIDEVTVCGFTMFSKAFPVVGKKYDESLV